MQNKIRILFCGGGTLGPVTPLLSVAEELNSKCKIQTVKCRFFWIGTRRGPERKLVEEAGISFSWIFAPKLRRYFDIRNFFVPLALHLATKIAWFKLLRMRPDVIVTAGGFVGVPVVWAGWWLRIPSVLHNQDVRFSLANKLVAPFVKKITYALPGTVPARWKHKSAWTGNPVRAFVLKGNKERGLKLCGFDDIGRPSLRVGTEAWPPAMPTILVVGGGTGAKRLNEIVVEALPELTKKYQVIHVTGIGKQTVCHSERSRSEVKNPVHVGAGSFAAAQDDTVRDRYCAFEFVTSEIGDLLAAADLVITRAGMGVLTELAALQKPMIIVPIPGSHQADNARYFRDKKAAVVLDQRTLDGKVLIGTIGRLFKEFGTMQQLAAHAGEFLRPNAASQIVDEIVGLVKS